MALPATGGGAGPMPMPWHDGAAAGHPPPPQQQQQQQRRRSLLALPPSTTTPAASGSASSSPHILAGFLHLPSIRAAGAPTPGHRLLWARIARPVPGVIPSAPGPGQNYDQDTDQDQDRRLGGRLWPCLFYYGGCAEVQKEIDAASGKL